MNSEEIGKLKQAGKIASETVKFARGFIKKGMSLLEIAEKIEGKIRELGGEPAFPVNLSINEIAAHSTPEHNSEETAQGLLKVDIGVSISGYIADTAFSIDLENLDENKKLIESAEKALKAALEKAKNNAEIKIIGGEIEKEIKNMGFQPIQNLSGHSIERWVVHSGTIIPNYNNSSNNLLETGVYAIEPFSTTGLGSVKDGKMSGIYELQKEGNVRDSFSRKILDHIREKYSTLPFCSRWLVNEFGTRAVLALKNIENAGIIKQFPKLIERGGKAVAQAEHTIIITENEKIISTA